MRGITSLKDDSLECPNEVSSWWYDNKGWKKGGNDIKVECFENGKHVL